MFLPHYRSSLGVRTFCFRIILFLLVSSGWTAENSAFSMEAIPRTHPTVGVIAGVSGDSEISFIEASQWRTAVVQQDLSTGDGLRTGSFGTMALLFADHTQIQVQRRSFLTVKSIATDSKTGTSVFYLKRGGTWSRTAVGGSGVKIETPSATAAIRGTDWSLAVDEKGSTRLIVLDGEVLFENPLGRIFVQRGEIAFAEIGKAPTKTILVHPRDREEQIYFLSLAELMQGYQLTDLKRSELRQARELIEALAKERRTSEQWLDLAELAHDMGDMAAVRQALASIKTTDVRLRARVKLVQGYLALFDFDFVGAEQLLAAAVPDLEQGRSLLARIGRVGALILLRRSTEAETLLSQIRQTHGDEPRYLLFNSILTAFAGDLVAAVNQVRQQTERFPNMADFLSVESAFLLVLDRPDEAKDAAERALVIDPGSSKAQGVLSLYRQGYLGDSEGALEVVRQGLSLNKLDDYLWGVLGYVYSEIGEQKMAEEALLRAIDLNPYSMASLYNYALLLLDQYRMAEADAILQRVNRIDPSRDFVLTLQGRLAMHTNQPSLAQKSFLKATTINPAMSVASMMLAQDYYQRGELALARQTLDNADRLDANEPLIPHVASVIASDRAYADQAIEYAREAIRRYRKLGGTGVTGLAASRGGSTNLGISFANLGLNDWADNYAELSFDPYSAESHMFRAAQDKDGVSSLYQGLLLDPLAAASRNRFVDFYRRPFNDSSVGASVGWPANGTSYGGTVNVQGFTLEPKPTSYWLNFDHSDTPNDRDNNDERQSSFSAAIGTNITPYDSLLFDVVAGTLRRGLPGTISLPDLDDDTDGQIVTGGLGYSHEFSARNILLARIMGRTMESEYSNEDALGSTDLSKLDYSLISNFGVEGARLLHEAGLTDLTDPADPNSPVVQIGGTSDFLLSTIPPSLDSNPTIRSRIEENGLSFKVRHMFTVDQVDFSYGAEVMPFHRETVTDSLELEQRDSNTGLIIGPNISIPFLFGDPVLSNQHFTQNGLAANGHVNALWRVNRNLRIESGLFVQKYDDDLDTSSTRLDPRVGVAWEVNEGNWLRLVLRHDMILPSQYTLAPVTTVGLLPNTEFLWTGSRSRLYAARWDREWSRRLFSTLELRRQDIDGFISSVPDSTTSLNVDRGRLDQAILTVNLWIKGGIGLFGRATLSDTEDRSDGADPDHGLPLIPEQRFNAGVTWVHPSQVRVSLSANHVGERPADVYGDGMLAAYQTVNLSASWQPLEKHLELRLAATNLFNHNYEVAQGRPARGQLITATAQWRF